MIRIGCSGWLYRDWRGPVYPTELAQRQWFEHYTSMFDTVELNTTFYRLPKPESVQKWHDVAPPGFHIYRPSSASSGNAPRDDTDS